MLSLAISLTLCLSCCLLHRSRTSWWAWSPPQVAALTVGRPEDNADITPVISESSANFIEGLVKDAQEKGEWV